MGIGYIGSSTTMLSFLKGWKNHNVCIWFCDSTHKSEELDFLSENLKIPLFYVDTDKQMEEQLDCHALDLEFFVVYKTGIILHHNLLQRYSFYNFHPGNLRTNRGAYPLVWTVLLGEKYATMSLHQICEVIDAGPLLEEVSVLVSEGDTPQELERKLEQEIPAMLGKIDSYRKNKLEAKIIENGKYRRKIRKDDYTIDFENDSIEVMERKIDSQREYQGAILALNGKEHRCFSVVIATEGDNYSEMEDHMIALERDGRKYVFTLWQGAIQNV